jgi:hypothetical protein
MTCAGVWGGCGAAVRQGGPRAHLGAGQRDVGVGALRLANRPADARKPAKPEPGGRKN